MAQLIVGVTPELAAALRRGAQSKDAAMLLELTERAGLQLEPQDMGLARDPDDTVWYWAESEGGDTSADLGEALMRVPGVTAAYLKPGVELP